MIGQLDYYGSTNMDIMDIMDIILWIHIPTDIIYIYILYVNKYIYIYL